MSIQVSVSGLVPPNLRSNLLDRLSNHSHSLFPFQEREVVFDRADLTEDSNVLRLRHLTTIPSSDWAVPEDGEIRAQFKQCSTLVSLGRPERERISPDFLIRPIFTCPILDGNPLELASALGYRQKFEFRKRGLAFVRGVVVIEVFQVLPAESVPVPADWPEAHLITVTAVISGSRSSSAGSSQVTPVAQQQQLKDEGCARVREVQAVLKGLVDLGRVEPF